MHFNFTSCNLSHFVTFCTIFVRQIGQITICFSLNYTCVISCVISQPRKWHGKWHRKWHGKWHRKWHGKWQEMTQEMTQVIYWSWYEPKTYKNQFCVISQDRKWHKIDCLTWEMTQEMTQFKTFIAQEMTQEMTQFKKSKF